ncbi:MAG: phosphatase PAP2 family protein, partial [Planctomycetales bacterium]|nr:phosphatase PAP2 family protein [Planctomycetales bacterium]
WRYPQGRWLFLAFAILAGCQRIAASAHYPSDVLAGAALGVLISGYVLSSHWFDPLEDKWSKPPRA